MQDLRMYLDSQGRLWFATQSRSASVTSLTPEDVIQEIQPASIRLYGAGSQASLILRCMEVFERTYIGSPSNVRACKVPSTALQSMTMLYGLPPYFGGWRLAAETDRSTFRFLDRMRQLDGSASEELRQHPAYAAMRFLRGGQEPDQQCLVCAMEDPRWFHRDINHPDRESKLRLFFGLTQRNAEAVYNNAEPDGYNHRRYRMLHHSFFHSKSFPRTSSDPHFFPSIMYQQLVREVSPERAVLRAMEYGLSFIRQAWLHAVAPPGRELFVPEYFFAPLGKTAGTLAAAAYRKTTDQPKSRASGSSPREPNI